MTGENAQEATPAETEAKVVNLHPPATIAARLGQIRDPLARYFLEMLIDRLADLGQEEENLLGPL
jgi:hypothetical protein